MNFSIIIFMFMIMEITFGNNNSGDNPVASSSGTNNNVNQQSQLNHRDKCEIRSYVDNTINLIISEVLLIENIDGLANPDQAFHGSTEYFRSVLNLIRYGENFMLDNEETHTLLDNYRLRMELFTHSVADYSMDRVLQIFQQFPQCSASTEGSLRFNSFQEMLLMSRISLILGIVQQQNTENLWELRELTLEESNLLPESRNPFNRFRRSLRSDLHKCYSLREYSKKRWNDFTVLLIRVFFKSVILKESTNWSCNLITLYQKYNSSLSNNSSNDCFKINFSSFLYSKISQLPDWNTCHEFDNSKNIDGWCQAWRRIMLNFNGNIEGNLKKLDVKFYTDLDTIVYWLRKRVFSKNKKTSRKPPNNVAVKKISVCYDNLKLLSCPNDCSSRPQMVLSRTIRSLASPSDILYERKWVVDSDNKLRCKCPEKNFIQTSNRTASVSSTHSSWWSWLLGSKKWKCEKGSPDRNSPRCDDLRR